MKALIASIAITLLTFGTAQAADEFLGPWASGDKEVLNITKDGEKLSAEFIRENVKFEFEKVQFPATVKDGTLVISSEQGDISAKFDDAQNVLIIGGLKAFQKLSPEKAQEIIKAVPAHKERGQFASPLLLRTLRYQTSGAKAQRQQ